MNRERFGWAGISSGAWSRRRGSCEDQTFVGRQGLLCLVQEAGQYPKSSRQPIQNFEQGFHAQIALKKASLPQAAGQTMCWKASGLLVLVKERDEGDLA